MRRRILRTIGVISLCIAMLPLCMEPAALAVSATTQEDVNAAENDAKETENRINRLKAELNNLQNNAASTKEYIAQLDKKYGEYALELNNTDLRISEKEIEIGAKKLQIEDKKLEVVNKQAEITNTENMLANAKSEQADHYAAMKLRIQYMYECGNQTFLDMIFSAEDLSDFLGKTEYINSITEYDRNKLEEMSKNQENIELMLASLQNQKSELEVAQADLENELDSLKQEETDLQTLRNKLKNEQTYIDVVLQQKKDLLSNYQNEANSTAAVIQAEQAKLEEQKAFFKRIKELYEQELAEANALGMDASDAAKQTMLQIMRDGGFKWPTPGYSTITTNFGYWTHAITHVYTLHAGTDISGYGINGKPIVASASGEVILAEWYYGYGYTVQISHGIGVVTQYSHCSSLAVSKGMKVTKGQTIAYVGASGNATGPHLHLGLYVEGNPVDPMQYFVKP